MKKLLLILMCIFLIGCVSSGSSHSGHSSSWLYKNINNLVSEKGYPDETITAPNGNKVYVYHKSKKVVKTEAQFVPWHARKVKTQRWKEHSYVDEQHCFYYYEVDDKNIIVNLHKKGNACR